MLHYVMAPLGGWNMVSGYIHILLNKSLEYSWEPEERDLCLRNKIKTTILQSTLKPASKYRTIKAGKIETCFLYRMLDG